MVNNNNQLANKYEGMALRGMKNKRRSRGGYGRGGYNNNNNRNGGRMYHNQQNSNDTNNNNQESNNNKTCEGKDNNES